MGPYSYGITYNFCLRFNFYKFFVQYFWFIKKLFIYIQNISKNFTCLYKLLWIKYLNLDGNYKKKTIY